MARISTASSPTTPAPSSRRVLAPEELAELTSVAELSPSIDDPRPDAHLAVAEALASSGSKEAVAPPGGLARDRDFAVAAAAIAGLSAMPSTRATLAARGAHFEFRAAAALGQLGDVRALPPLARRPRLDPVELYSGDHPWQGLARTGRTTLATQRSGPSIPAWETAVA